MNIDGDLNAVFEPQVLTTPGVLGRMTAAFEQLARHAAGEINTGLPSKLQFDPVAMTSLMARFQRDAFGVYYYHRLIDDLVMSRKDMDGVAEILKGGLDNLSIRINAPNPFKTRVAAAFSLWVSACRPFTVS